MRIQQARAESNGTIDFSKRTYNLLSSSIVYIILLAVFLIIPIVMIIVGATHLNDCPRQELIPIFLMVTGGIGTMKCVCAIIESYRSRFNGGVTSCFNEFLTSLFLLSSFAGHFWILKAFNTTDENELKKYCNQHLLNFAYAILIGTDVLFGLIVVGCFGFCIWVSNNNNKMNQTITA